MTNLFHIVRDFSKRIQNNRTPKSTLLHLQDEVQELDEEINLADNGEPSGVDGIIGEAIDVIACALDIINQVHPNMDDNELEDLCSRIMLAKCEKWARVYG